MMNADDSYKKYFASYVPELIKGVQQYRVDVLVDWIKTHLNQPMPKEEMYADIMLSKVFTEYKGRPMGQDLLNRKLQIYGVKIISVREFKRNENRNKTFWELVQI